METQIANWIDRFYRPDRLHREPGTRRRIIADRVNDVRKYGETLISRHDSLTGRAEWFTATSSSASD